jgi:rhodanese-related sulfurtransferase
MATAEHDAVPTPYLQLCHPRAGTHTNTPQEFAFAKPLPEQKIIFFCRSGKRSATAAEFGDIKGYPNIRNYVGSMLDWAEHEGLDPEKLGL